MTIRIEIRNKNINKYRNKITIKMQIKTTT